MHRFFGRAVMAGGALLIAATAQAQNAGGVGRSYKFGGDLGASRRQAEQHQARLRFPAA